MNNFQQTIKNEASISGFGLHSGKSVTITLKPAPAGHGIKFQRIDLEGMPILDANCDWVTNSERSTTIEKKWHKINYYRASFKCYSLCRDRQCLDRIQQ